MKQGIAFFLILGYFLHIGIVFSQEILSEQYMYFLDINSNNKIDTLEIPFSDTLMGTLDMDKLFLYSASGGVSSTKLDSVFGNQIFSGYTLSGNILTLFLHEQDIEGTGLIINNTTSSHLRLKTNAGVGIHDSFGNEIKLLYTSSFNNYKNIAYKSYQETQIIPPIETPIDTQTGTLSNTGTLDSSGTFNISNETLTQTGIFTSSGTQDASGELSQSGTQNDMGTGVINLISSGTTSSGETLSGTLFQAFTGKILFQNPTYFTDKSENLAEYHCLTNQTDCKVNYNLELDSGSGFTTISSTKYNCEWDFGFGEFIEEKYKCNPNTITYPEGTFETTYTISEIAHPENVFQKKIKIVNSGYIAPVPVTKTIYRTIEKERDILSLSVPKIEIQSGIDADGNCLREECSVNLNYSPKDVKELCQWKFPGGIYDSGTDKKCNPSYVKYPLGDYEATLKVYEEGNEGNYKESRIQIHNKKILTQKISETPSKDTVSGVVFTGSFSDYSGLKIIKVFPNPSGKDDEEFIQIQNTSSGSLNLKGCFFDDKIKSGSKPYLVETDEIFAPEEIKKYFKDRTNLNFDNSAGDEVNLICQENIIDTFSWNFGVGNDVILDENNRYFTGEVLEISKENLKNQVLPSNSNSGELTPESLQILNKNFTQKIKKLKKGIKIYGTTFANMKVVIEIVKKEELSFFAKAYAENGIYEVYSDAKGKYELLLPPSEIGEFEVKNTLVYNDFTFPIEKVGDFEVESDYIDYVQFDAKKSKSFAPKELKANITLQKVAKGISVSGNKIICQNMSECSINFDGRTSTGNIKTYFWDFGNGVASQKANPAGVKFASGKYVVSFKVTDGTDEEENFFLVSVIPKAKALSSSSTTKKEKTTKDTKTLGKTSKIDIVPKQKHAPIQEKSFEKNLYLSILIGVLFLLGGAVILKREQII